MIQVIDSNGNVKAEVVTSVVTGLSYQSIGVSDLGNYSGTTGTVDGRMIFVGGNNITLSQSINGQSATITVSAFNQSLQPAIGALSAGTTKGTSGTVAFSNSNGVSFGMNGNVITASIDSGINSPATVSAGTRSYTLGQLVFSNSNSVSFGLSGSTLTASFSQSSQAQSSLAFSNSNGVSFGIVGSTLTATVKTDYLTTAMQSDASTQFVQANAVFHGTNASGTIASDNISVSVNAQSAQPVAASAANGSFLFSTLAFADSNGVSFSTGTQGLYATVKTDYLTTAMQSDAGSNFVNTSAGLNLTNISATLHSNSVSLSVSNQTAFVLSNSNGISFGTNASTVTASYTVPTITNSSWTLSDANTSLTIAQLAFTNSNGLTLSLSTTTGGKATIVGSYTVPNTSAALTNINISAGSTSNNLSALTFNNSNGISFGLNGSVITATVQTNYLTSQSNQALSAGNGSFAFQTATFADSNGVSFSTGTQGIFATVKTDYLTSQSNQAFSASGGSSAFQTLSFGNSNGLTFSNSNGSVIASYTVPSVTNSSWTVSDANTSATVGRLAFTNSNGLTLSLSTSNNGNHTVIGSYTVPTVTNSSWTVSDANTSATVGRLAFTNSNGLTLSLSTSNNGNHTVIGSYTVPSTAGLISAINLSAGTTSNNLSKVTFADSNGISFGLNGSVVTATVQTNYLTTAMASDAGSRFVNTSAGLNLTNISATLNSNSVSLSVAAQSTQPVAASAGNGSFNFSTLKFVDSNGISWSTGTNGIIGTVQTNYLTTARASNDAIGLNTAQSNVTWTVNSSGLSIDARGYAGTGTTFAGTNVSASLTLNSNGLNIALSAPNAGGGSINFSAGTTSGNLDSVVFSNSNSINFGLNGSTITASYSNPLNWALTGNTAGTTASTIGTTPLYLAGGNGVTVSGNSNTISFNINTSPDQISLVGNTSGTNSWSVTGDQFNFSGGNNITLSGNNGTLVVSGVSFSNSNGISFGLNAGTLTASTQAPFQSYYMNVPGMYNNTQFATAARSTSLVAPFFVPFNVSASYMRLPLSMSMASTSFATTANTTFSASVLSTINCVVYSLGTGANSRSLQSVASGSAGISFQMSLQANSNGSQYTVSQNITYPREGANTDNLQTNFALTNASFQISTGSLSNFTGNRFIDIPFANSLSAGAYWMAIGVSSTTSTQGTNALTGARPLLSSYAISQLNANVGLIGSATNSSVGWEIGIGSFTTNAIGTTASIPLANISSVASQVIPIFQLIRQA